MRNPYVLLPWITLIVTIIAVTVLSVLKLPVPSAISGIIGLLVAAVMPSINPSINAAAHQSMMPKATNLALESVHPPPHDSPPKDQIK